MAKITIRQTVEIKASPHDVYETLMDPEKHSELINDKVAIERKVNGKFSTFNGYSKGKFIELIQDRRIIHTWRANDWMKDDVSTVTITLKPTKAGTQLDFVQTGVPERFIEAISGGWEEYYWKPMKRMLER